MLDTYKPIVKYKDNRLINRGTQRLLSVKYLFGEVHVEDSEIFLVDRYIHVQFSNVISNKFPTFF